MTKQDEAPAVAFIDDPHAPEVFAPEAVGFFLNAGNVHVTFVSPRVNNARR
jgi:hypothetical protein